MFPHGFALELDAMSPVNQSIQNGIGHGGITDHLVPAGGRELAGDQR